MTSSENKLDKIQNIELKIMIMCILNYKQTVEQNKEGDE